MRVPIRDRESELYINRYYDVSARTMAIARSLAEAERLILAYYATEDGAQYVAENNHYGGIVGAQTALPKLTDGGGK